MPGEVNKKPSMFRMMLASLVAIFSAPDKGGNEKIIAANEWRIANRNPNNMSRNRHQAAYKKYKKMKMINNH